MLRTLTPVRADSSSTVSSGSVLSGARVGRAREELADLGCIGWANAEWTT
jgi:hypothetical protein